MSNTNNEMFDEENPDLYTYPNNFQNTGRILSGMIETKKLMEALVVSGVLGLIEYVLLSSMDMMSMIAIMVVTVGPVLILGVVGIGGDSLSEFAKKVIDFMKNKRKLRYRRIVKDAKTTTSRSKSRPTNKKTSK